MSELQNNLAGVADPVQEVKVNVCKTNKDLLDAIDEMKNHMTCNNLIIRGLPEEENKELAESERIIKVFFLTTLKLTLSQPID